MLGRINWAFWVSLAYAVLASSFGGLALYGHARRWESSSDATLAMGGFVLFMAGMNLCGALYNWKRGPS